MAPVSVYDRTSFERYIASIEADVTAFAIMVTNDAHVRSMYAQQIRQMSSELIQKVHSHQLNWAQAAEEANQTRNAILELLRTRSSPVGRAAAQQMKLEGKTLNELIAKKTASMHGASANFNQLSPAQKDRIYMEVVKAAGKSNPKVNMWMIRASRAGKSLIFLSLAISVYQVATAEDKVSAAKREVAVTAAGFAGSVAGGALAGLACGPGAPVCVAIGAFIGGAAFAFGVSSLW